MNVKPATNTTNWIGGNKLLVASTLGKLLVVHACIIDRSCRGYISQLPVCRAMCGYARPYVIIVIIAIIATYSSSFMDVYYRSNHFQMSMVGLFLS